MSWVVNRSDTYKWRKERISTRKAGVMLNPIMDIDVRQIKYSGCVVPTEDAGNRVWDIPTECWSKVVVVTDYFV